MLGQFVHFLEWMLSVLILYHLDETYILDMDQRIPVVPASSQALLNQISFRIFLVLLHRSSSGSHIEHQWSGQNWHIRGCDFGFRVTISLQLHCGQKDLQSSEQVLDNNPPLRRRNWADWRKWWCETTTVARSALQCIDKCPSSVLFKAPRVQRFWFLWKEDVRFSLKLIIISSCEGWEVPPMSSTLKLIQIGAGFKLTEKRIRGKWV